MLLMMDLDGVLVDCRTAVFEAYRKGFEHIERCLDHSAFEEIMDGLRWPDSARAVFPSISDEELAKVREIKDACFGQALQDHPGKVDKIACSLVKAFVKIGWEIWLVTAGSERATNLKLGGLPTEVRELFNKILTGIDKTGDAFYGDLLRYIESHWTIILVDDDPRVWEAARENLSGISVLEWEKGD